MGKTERTKAKSSEVTNQQELDMRRGNVLYKMWYKCFSNSQDEKCEKFKDDGCWQQWQRQRQRQKEKENAEN